jgi:hypothetical protein
MANAQKLLLAVAQYLLQSLYYMQFVNNYAFWVD